MDIIKMISFDEIMEEFVFPILYLLSCAYEAILLILLIIHIWFPIPNIKIITIIGIICLVHICIYAFLSQIGVTYHDD